MEDVACGVNPQHAPKSAGFSASYARKASRLLKVPAVARAVAEIRERGRTLAAYDLTAAMKEAEDVIVFAKLKGNAIAYFKAVEHKPSYQAC